MNAARLLPLRSSFLAFAAASLWLTATAADPSPRAVDVRVVEAIPTAQTNGFFVANKPPLQPSPLLKLPIGSIVPRGWLRHQLELEADGMIGHLPEISKWCKFEGNAWSSPEGRGHSA
ncbi:MAG TPA: hypothetical protein VN794_15870 [Methylomirabilota bacterium]|nr:hypothetical protein [Methylomirabilota bacterium]